MRPMRLVIIVLAATTCIVAQERFAGRPFLNSTHVRATSSRSRILNPLQAGAVRVVPRPGRVASHAYRRFHANDSLVGKSIPCTQDEKSCFHFNLLFDPRTDKCQPMGARIDRGCHLAPNRQAFLNGSGRIFGTCLKYDDPCPGYRMSSDGRCYPKEMVRDVICGCNAEPTRHILGGVECRCSPTAPLRVDQPRRDGLCRIPDLRFPDVLRRSFLHYPGPDIDVTSNVTCSEKQSRCFSQGKVWVKQGNGCFPLLKRGPCPQDHVVALDARAAQRGIFEAVCSDLRGGCLPRHKRIVFDGKCHSDRFLKIAAPGKVFHDIFGRNVIQPEDTLQMYLPTSTRPNVCSINVGMVGSPSPNLQYPKPPCGGDNESYCSLYVVEAEPPMPD